MFGIPMYVYFFLFAALAALAARFLVGRVGDDPGSFPGWILYGVAAGCVLIGLALIGLDR